MAKTDDLRVIISFDGFCNFFFVFVLKYFKKNLNYENKFLMNVLSHLFLLN